MELKERTQWDRRVKYLGSPSAECMDQNKRFIELMHFAQDLDNRLALERRETARDILDAFTSAPSDEQNAVTLKGISEAYEDDFEFIENCI
jgi:hypothetical protein